MGTSLASIGHEHYFSFTWLAGNIFHMKSSTTQRRAFLGAAAAGIAGVATSVATATPAAAVEDSIPASQKGAANGVAPLDGSKKVPVEHIPTEDGKAPASVEHLSIRARDRSIGSTWEADQSEKIQAAVNEAATAGARLVFQKGVYICSNINIPANSWIGSASTPHSLAGSPPVRIVNKDRADTPIFWWGGDGVNAYGIRLEGLTFWGGMAAVTGPLLHQRTGFEVQIDNVQLLENWHGPGFVIDGASNCRYVDLQVQNCGTTAWPAVMMNHGGHPWPSNSAPYSNTNDFDRLRVERAPNVGMSIGMTDSWDKGSAEFTRLTSPHFETDAQAGVKDALIQVGNVYNLDIVAPTFVAGPGGALSHLEAARSSASRLDPGGITVLGGSTVGRYRAPAKSTTAENRTNPYMFDLQSGNGFALLGTRVTGYNNDGVAVRIGEKYGPDVQLQPLFRSWGAYNRDGFAGRLALASDARKSVSPTARVESPAGSDAKVTVTGRDRRGHIEFTPGAGAAKGTQFTFTLTRTLRSRPVVTLTPENVGNIYPSVGAMLKNVYFGSFQVAFATAPEPGRTYTFHYALEEVQE
ncbi:hypothetical protein ABCS02_34360 [Microbacterium sp. X-17]|uniref:hypothetical protein n=1 Tax=Microbacterium sp. X-17 TaxID=3144404 RepID=UPI0031F512B3